jgi:hypothetical protein
MKPFPANHASFATDSCTTCHQPGTSAGSTGSTASTAPTIPHSIEGDAYKDCTFCHGADKIKPFPANHATFAADSCTTCHQPAAAPAAAEATAVPAPTAEE